MQAEWSACFILMHNLALWLIKRKEIKVFAFVRGERMKGNWNRERNVLREQAFEGLGLACYFSFLAL